LTFDTKRRTMSKLLGRRIMKRSPRPRNAVKLSDSVHQRLSMYALAASAAGVGCWRWRDQPRRRSFILERTVLSRHTTTTSLTLTMTRRSISPSAMRPLAPRTSVFYRLLQKPAAGNSGINVFKGYVLASALKRGSRIGPGRHFSDQTAAMVGIDSAYPFNYVFGQWVNVQRRYLGLRFKIKGQTHYGWARLNVRVVLPPHSAITAVLTGYAYETIPNRPILAGKTKGPDVTTVSPASLGHLAAGASAIPALRTRSP